MQKTADSETMAITLHFQVWDVKKKELMVGYSTEGGIGGTMLITEKGVNYALEAACRTAIRYLNSGK